MCTYMYVYIYAQGATDIQVHRYVDMDACVHIYIFIYV